MRKELIRRLKKMQKWRRGYGMNMPYTPREFGLMIDECIKVLKAITDEQFDDVKKNKEDD